MPASQAPQTADVTMLAGVSRHLVVLLSALWLVWTLALTLAAPLDNEATAQAGYSASWQSLPEQTEPILLQAQSERSSPQLFLPGPGVVFVSHCGGTPISAAKGSCITETSYCI